MIISFNYFSSSIKFEDGKIPVLVIENKQLYRNVLRSFIDEEQDEYFTFSENFEPFEFNKNGYFILNPIDLDFNNKKLANKINSYLAITVNDEFLPELSEIQKAFYNLADKLVSFSSFDIKYEKADFDAIEIIKLLSFKISVGQTLAESFVSFILLLSAYLKLSVFVVSNLYVYFTYDEIEKILKTLVLNHINLLLIEQSAPNHNSNYETLYILDNDLCQIDKEVIK